MLPRTARVAILKPEHAGIRHAEIQLMREACVVETLQHAGVPRVYECGVLDRRPWVATEQILGTSIENAAAQRPLSTGDAIAVVRDASAVLAHAHRRGVIHSDITPRSILRTAQRGFPVCITEWASAAIYGTALPRSDDPAARFYRAPEVTGGDRGSAAADVFALGAVMFEAATLALPDPVQKFPGMPPALHQLLARMLARAADDRPTAEAVHAEAARLAELYNDGDAAIEEVEVELVDISRAQGGMHNLGWIPPERVPRASQTMATPRRRKDS
ncbi:MAG TPA: protein kinase [Kofleriaceae bacterium]|nr:protein kinase [Kofleriaceae bacterium]